MPAVSHTCDSPTWNVLVVTWTLVICLIYIYNVLAFGPVALVFLRVYQACAML